MPVAVDIVSSAVLIRARWMGIEVHPLKACKMRFDHGGENTAPTSTGWGAWGDKYKLFRTSITF